MPRRVQTSSPPARPARPARPVAPLTEEALREAFKDFPAVELLTRRFNDPRDPGSMPILLADEDPNACINSEHQQHVKPGHVTCLRPIGGGKRCGLPVRKWFVYWGNLAKEGRYAQLMAKAYVPVEVKELRDEMDVADLVKTTDDRARVLVRRGDRGQELLMKQPLAAWNLIKAKRRAAALARQQSAEARKHARAESLGQRFGDQAGQMAHDGGIREETFTRTRTTLGEEAGGADGDAVDD